MTDKESWLDYADHLHDEAKADRCKCGGEARYWLPGDVYVCLRCYQAQDVQVTVEVVRLCSQCDMEVEETCPNCGGAQ